MSFASVLALILLLGLMGIIGFVKTIMKCSMPKVAVFVDNSLSTAVNVSEIGRSKSARKLAEELAKAPDAGDAADELFEKRKNALGLK